MNGQDSKPIQQYWYHHTRCGSSITKEHKYSPLEIHKFDVNSNGRCIFGGVSGKQLVVFSVLSKHTDHMYPVLVGQSVLFLSSRSQWCNGYTGKIPILETDEVILSCCVLFMFVQELFSSMSYSILYLIHTLMMVIPYYLTLFVKRHKPFKSIFMLLYILI